MTYLLVIAGHTNAQNDIKVRVFGNYSWFMGEPQGKEEPFPEVTRITENSGFTDFTNKGGAGFGAEFMMSLSNRASLGIELSTSKFSGFNDAPPPYNFQYTPLNQLQVTWLPVNQKFRVNELFSQYFEDMLDPLEYSTSLTNLLLNFRFYLMTEGKFLPFLKAHSGISFVGSELTYRDDNWHETLILQDEEGFTIPDEDIDWGAPILYARGTKNSTDNRMPALNLGGGAGFEYKINDKLNLYVDYTISMIKSDIMDGRPNMDFIEAKLYQFNTFGNVSRLSFGLTYTIGEGMNMIGGSGGGSKGGGSRSGTSDPHLPFYEKKRAR